MTRRAPSCRVIATGLALVCIPTLDHALPPAAARPALRLARRVKRHTSLTGVWTGAYSYAAHEGRPPVPFNARLEETGGAFSGDIDEPNTYAHPSAPRLYAAVNGARTGLEVRFLKQMDGTGGAAHAIHYVGTADSDLSRIDGSWTINGVGSTFFMERAGVEAEAAAERAASATG